MKMDEIKGTGAAETPVRAAQYDARADPHAWSRRSELPTGCHQLRLGDGIATGKQRDLMPLADECFREIGDHAFGAAIPVRWHAFKQGATWAIFIDLAS